jgi:hypothetical protein
MTAKIKLNAASGGGSVSLEAPTSTTGNANVEFKLPVADGSSGQALTTNASGQLAFASVSAGGASNIAFNDGYGIDFSASGSGTSSLFHDYEEGTWTPTAHGYTGSNTTNNCFYTKIGRLVIATFRITWPSLTNSSAAEIRNLPFTARSQAVNTHGGSFAETNDNDNLHMIVQQNTTSMYILRCTSSGVDTQTITEVSGKDFRGNVIYFTDA